MLVTTEALLVMLRSLAPRSVAPHGRGGRTRRGAAETDRDGRDRERHVHAEAEPFRGVVAQAEDFAEFRKSGRKADFAARRFRYDAVDREKKGGDARDDQGRVPHGRARRDGRDRGDEAERHADAAKDLADLVPDRLVFLLVDFLGDFRELFRVLLIDLLRLRVNRVESFSNALTAHFVSDRRDEPLDGQGVRGRFKRRKVRGGDGFPVRGGGNVLERAVRKPREGIRESDRGIESGGSDFVDVRHTVFPPLRSARSDSARRCTSA